MTPRLKSEFTVAAIRKTVQAHGAFCTILRHGHDEAGMIHLVWRVGAQISVWSEAACPDGSRGWRCRKADTTEAEATTLLEKERSFDPDLWVVEIDGEVPRDVLPGTFLPD